MPREPVVPPEAPSTSVPAPMVVPPLKVFVPDRVQVPPPMERAIVLPLVPSLMGPLIVLLVPAALLRLRVVALPEALEIAPEIVNLSAEAEGALLAKV